MGTLQLSVIGAFDGVPGDEVPGNGNYDLPVETVATGQIEIQMRKLMNYKFDELAKGLAQSVTRRQPRKLSGFGVPACRQHAEEMADEGLPRDLS